MSDDVALIESLIADVPDFPKPGIMFKDITPLLADPAGLRAVTAAFQSRWADAGITQIVGVESRGFILGAALAQAMGVGLTLVRKPGKLPRETRSASYELEYGTDTLQIHADALGSDDVALIVDDVLATGGTAAAVVGLVQETGATLAGVALLMDLTFLNGRAKLPADVTVHSILAI